MTTKPTTPAPAIKDDGGDLVLKYNGEIYAFIGANEYNLTDVDLMFWR